MRRVSSALGVGLVAWCASGAHAQTVRIEPPPPPGYEATGPQQGAEHGAGVYTGVKPGGNEAPAVPVKAGTTPASVTWPGFQMRPDGSSRVFLQTSAPVQTSVSSTGQSFVVDLGDARIVGETNRFPLLTQHFNTPVTRVSLKRENNRTSLVITLRANVQPSVSTDHAQSGFFFLYVDFPPGNYVSGARASSAAPPPPDGTALDSGPPAPSSGAASASASGSLDGELPPGMGKTKAKAKAKASGKAKIGF